MVDGIDRRDEAGLSAVRFRAVNVLPWVLQILVFIGVHVKYGEVAPIVFSGALGLVMAFVAYGRAVLKPIV